MRKANAKKNGFKPSGAEFNKVVPTPIFMSIASVSKQCRDPDVKVPKDELHWSALPFKLVRPRVRQNRSRCTIMPDYRHALFDNCGCGEQ